MADKKTASDLRKEAEQLVKDGKMPALHELLGAVAETRGKYSDKIKQAQKGGK